MYLAHRKPNIMSEKKLFLLDGHALVYRAHFAFITRPLINSKGVNTSAMTGFTRTLWDLLRNEKPTHIAVAFDPPTKTFRHDMYEPYKANREAQPEDITIAMPYIHRIVKAFNIPIIMVDNYEADDTIGTIAKQAEKEGFQVYMVTPDKDYGQLVSENIFLYKPSRQGNGVDIMGVKEICEKWNITRVDQVIDMLGLMGDSVDNIPGIPGIGEKTAAKLLGQFDSIENLIASSDQLKGKQKERVEEFRDQAVLSKKLAIIDIEVPIQFDAATYVIDPINREALSEVFKELEFRGLSKQILGEEQAAATPSNQAGKQGNLFGEPDQVVPLAKSSALPKHSVADKHIGNTEHEYHLVDDAAKRAELIQLLSQQEVFCFDTETTGIDANIAELVGMSFAVKAGEAYYVPVPEDQTEAQALVAEFKAVFENEKIAKIGQNIKYDVLILKWYDVEVKGHYFDTMVMHYLMEPELRHNMDYLSETYLKYSTVHIVDLIGKKGKNQLTMRDVPVEKV